MTFTLDTAVTDAMPRELQLFEGARQISDGDCVIAGTGLPLLAGLVAQRAHAPRAQLIIESGVVFPRVVPTPMSVVDPRLMNEPSRLGSLVEVLGGFVQRGMVATGFLGGAQIDRYANINSTWIRRDHGWVRLPGSGGAADIASLCSHVVILTEHELRRFPRQCDYVTSPGFVDGPGGRERAGLDPLRVTVITNLGVLTGDDTTAELTLTHLMPGASVDDVLANTGFEPAVADEVAAVRPPSSDQLRQLRTVLDPQARYFPERTSTSRHTSTNTER